MLQFLWRLILALAALLFVRMALRRFFPQLGGRARNDRREGRLPSNEMVKDPVCGMYVDPRLALPLKRDGETVFFCSDACRSRYQSDK